MRNMNEDYEAVIKEVDRFLAKLDRQKKNASA